MLTWNVTYHCKPGKREEFFKAISDLGVRACSIHETGNLKYDYFWTLRTLTRFCWWKPGRPRRTSSATAGRRPSPSCKP